jgi:ParB/RepB/Spo0J family partition protein
MDSMKIETVALSKIKLGTRYRRDYGDLEDLAQSIGQVGLLQPIVVNENHELICGERRLRAFAILKLPTIPCQILDISALAGEFSENIYRLPFSPTERFAIAEAVEKEMGKRAGRPSELLTLETESKKKENGKTARGATA